MFISGQSRSVGVEKRVLPMARTTVVPAKTRTEVIVEEPEKIVVELSKQELMFIANCIGKVSRPMAQALGFDGQLPYSLYDSFAQVQGVKESVLENLSKFKMELR